MYKQILAVALIVGCLVAVSLAGPIADSEEVQQGMKNAFRAGRDRFEGAANAQNEQAPAPAPRNNNKKIFSEYTKDLTALGGGRPLLREMNRVHHYTPLAPSVLPKQFHIAGDKMTAEEAAKIIVPGNPYQYTEDHQH